MNIRQWVFGCSVVLIIGCSDDNKQASVTKSAKPGAESKTYQNIAGMAAKETPRKPEYAAKTPGYLEQNWDHEKRMEWWYTSQGSRLLPYDWFLALERPDSEEKVSSKENLEQYRFVAWPADSKWNPDGLPIGFVADKDAASGTRHLGFTCAACHTGKVAYKGNEYIVEGAPAHHDIDRFTVELATSLQKTADNSDKFSRFVAVVLGANAKAEDAALLKQQLSQQSSKLGERLKINRPPYPNGYGRLDAFGNIFNEVVVTAINEPSNIKPADAPVSYPVLWDTPQHDVVQWNGLAVNAGIGPYSRNTGEVVGVFGDLRIEPAGGAGSPEMSFNNHININNLKRLEEILTTLWSPLWTEKLLPSIDQAKAQRGRQIFEKSCASCHHDIKRDDPTRKIEAAMIPLTDIGTDPTMAENAANRMSKTGILEGQTIFPLSKLAPILPKFRSEDKSVQMVLYSVVGILRDGLDPAIFNQGISPFLEAAKKNALKDNCDPKKEGEKCLRPPAYKARPLNGIWASAPFLHNGSVPNLWELLRKPDQRVTAFNVGSWEMDPVKVGFVTGVEPATSKFDTTLSGNSNKGHEYGSDLTDKDKWALIEYLKTL
jgi:mono/diheme cytochrome c family protein